MCELMRTVMFLTKGVLPAAARDSPARTGTMLVKNIFEVGEYFDMGDIMW